MVTINFVPIRGPYQGQNNGKLNGPYSIDFHVGTKSKDLAISTNMPIDIFHERIKLKTVKADDQSVPSNFAETADLGSREIKIGTVKDDNIAGFRMGEIFTSRNDSGAGDLGVIVRISPDGADIQNPWVRLPNPALGVVYGLHVDTTGVFNGDLIAITQLGNVWRINSNGSNSPCPIASLNRWIDGITTVPNDTGRYGPWAGKILVGAPRDPVDPHGRPENIRAEQIGIYAISPDGHIEFFSCNRLHMNGMGLGGNIVVVPENQNFFALQYASSDQDQSTVWAARSSDFQGIVGDILYQQWFPSHPNSGLWRIHWDSASNDFQSEQLSTSYNNQSYYVHHWTGMTFAPLNF